MTMEGPLAEGSVFRWKAGPGTITSTLRRFQKTLDGALGDGLRYLKAEAEQRRTR
jgi:hypothetical protein